MLKIKNKICYEKIIPELDVIAVSGQVKKIIYRPVGMDLPAEPKSPGSGEKNT